MRWHRSSEDCLLNSRLKFQGRPNGQKNGAGVKQFNKYFGCLLYISLQFFGSQRWNCNKFLSLYGFSSHRLWIPGLLRLDSKEVAFSGTILATDTPLSTFVSSCLKWTRSMQLYLNSKQTNLPDLSAIDCTCLRFKVQWYFSQTYLFNQNPHHLDQKWCFFFQNMQNIKMPNADQDVFQDGPTYLLVCVRNISFTKCV